MNTNRIYTLTQAATLTGFSEGKFRYPKNKTALLNAGATITDSGAWRIPHTTLQQLGWIGVKPPKGEVAPPTSLEQAEMKVAELEAEVRRLTSLLQQSTTPTRKKRLFGR